MQTKQYKIIAISVLLVLVALLGILFPGEDEIVPLSNETLLTYQSNSCELSLVKFLITNGVNETFIFKFDSYSNMDCFGKIKYIEPVNNTYLVLIGTHTLINLLLQSIFWLTLMGLIKKDDSTSGSFSLYKVFLTSFIFCSLFIVEDNYNAFNNTTYSPKIESGNYLAFSYFLSVLIIIFLINKVLVVRINSLINYFPYLFLFGGVYQNLNVNFFVIIFVFFGFYNLENLNKTKSIVSIIYFSIMSFWVVLERNQYGYFDVDKLRGFVSSSNDSLAILFWALIFYLLVNGILFLTKQGTTNFEILVGNMLKSSFYIVLLGLLSSLSNFINLFVFYFFGQNKQSKIGLDSVAGNTWRGFSPTAEGIGEFYGLVLLISFWVLFVKQKKLDNFQYVCLIFTFYGFVRANNIAALITLVIIITSIIIFKKITNVKARTSLYLFLATVFLISSYFILRQNTYAAMGYGVVFEGWQNSRLSDVQDVNMEIVDDFLKGKDFKSLQETYKNKGVISSSLVVITDTLISENNIRFLPNPVTLLGVAGVFINRAEKWGLFFASYNPNLSTALLGNGAFNISNYYYDQSLFDGSLILPHSSIFSYVIFLGILPVFSFIIYLLFIIFRNYNFNDFNLYSVLFLIINLIKSDSLLYFPSFVMFIYFIGRLKEKKDIS